MLDPMYFEVDDRTLADFLVFIEKYADFVYSNQIRKSENDVIVPTWRPFFYSDISVFLAKLSSLNPNEFLPFYLKDEVAGTYEIHRTILQTKLNSIIKFISFVTESYFNVLNVHGNDPNLKQLVNQIEQIRGDGHFELILKLASSLELIIPNKKNLPKNFEKLWGSIDFLSVKKDMASKESDAHNLNKSINNFFAVAGQMIYYSKSLFLESINADQHHTPGTALFIAFLKLYQVVQGDLNNITKKHLDYFYGGLLQQKIKPSEPDYVHVCFSLADHVDTFVIQKGTLLKAGIDNEGYDRLYATDDFLTLNKTKLTDLCALYISQRKEVGMENSYDFISNIYETAILTSKAGGFDFSSKPFSFSSFEKSELELDYTSIKISEVGLAIASPILMMREGRRECNLTFNFNVKSLSTLLTFLERYTTNENLTIDKAFHKLFYRAFSVSLTTNEGWYELEDYKLFSPDSANGSFKLSFVLPMGAPAITAMDNTWDKTEAALYNTEWPIVKLCLTSKKSMLVYSYLKDLVLLRCTIDVSVTGIKNLEVFNDLGQLDTSNPFYPFGSVPVLGSTLLVGNEELYKKNIDDFSFELAWYNLPRTKGGFKIYYEEYDPQLENDSFTVGVTALSDFEFHPTSKDKIEKHALFAMVEEKPGELPVIAPVTILQGFDLNRLRINADYSSTPLPPYNNKARMGYIKLELLSPEMAFGQAIYPTLFSSKILKGLKSSTVDLPNPPYIPQLKSITLNYKASTKIAFKTTSLVNSDPRANEKVFRLQPFGILTIFEKHTPIADNFLPQYSENGYLFLGFDTITPNEPLTLHFVLDPSIGNEFEVDLPVIEWFYVMNDRWILFEKKDLVFDTTRSFTTTGIVKLLMPKALDNQNNILPKNKYWLIASIKGDLGLVAKIIGIYTQALKLVWTPHKEGATWSTSIAPNTIEGFLNAKKEVASIFQPSASFGGRDVEKPLEFYTRVSERLQHRNRCVTAWDYERMVLEKFPYVNQTKCISPIDNPIYVEEGKVILIVAPKPRLADDFIFPRFNYSVLQEIKNYIEDYIPPFVSIQIINPVYEEVKISASVKFKDESKKGIGVENLHRDLRDFICPWYTDSTKEIQFGGSINQDELETYIATRDYVSYVTNIAILILHYHDKIYSLSDSVLTSVENKTLHASKPWVVLIPMNQHPISIIEDDVYMSPGQAAVENLRIGSEFVLVGHEEENDMETTAKDKTSIRGGFITIDIDL